MPGEKRDTVYRVEALSKQHNRSVFSCGKEALDEYLRVQAGQDVRKHVAAVFVLCEGPGESVRGYYTLSAVSVDVGAWPENIAKKLPRYPMVPATLLGRLAIDQAFQGKRAGEYLLLDALHRSLLASREVASVAVVVDAKDDEAAGFYQHYDFVPLLDPPNRLFLPMSTIAKLFR